MRTIGWLILLLTWSLSATAGLIEVETLAVPGGSVMAAEGASGGRALRVDLAQAQSGVVATLPLPPTVLPGKYLVSLRVQFAPTGAYSDGFTLGLGGGGPRFMPADCPDLQASDWRLWTVPVVVDGPEPKLVLALDRSPYLTEPKTQAMLLDSLNVQRQGDQAFLVSVQPGKVMYTPGEDAVAQVQVRNLGPATTRKLRAVEIRDLGTVRPLGEQTVTLKPTDSQVVEFKWKLGPEEYGREIRVEMLDPTGKVVDRVGEYFHVADNVWKVAMRSPSGPHMTNPSSIYCDIKTPEAWANYIGKQMPNAIRASYGNFTEWFAWAPDDVFFMTPTAENWISGQGCYQHTRSRIMDLMALYKREGIWPITYAKSSASGPPCFEFMRKHPEWSLGRYQTGFDQQFVRDWDKQIPGQEKTIFYTWISLVMDITQPGIVDAGINEILNSAEMFGWRGARYDDHYTYWGKPYDPLSTRNMQRIFDLGKQKIPGFVWGFNYIASWTTCVWPSPPLADAPWKQTLRDPALPADPSPPRFEKVPEVYPELKVACENGAYIMNEQAREGSGGNYSTYARLLTNEARLVRSYGGHYGPIPFDPAPNSAFNSIYPDLLRAASRAHTYGNSRGGRDFLQFLTRYSDLIYGTSLTPITDPEAVLTVDAQPGLWWHMFAYTQKEAGHNRVIVHLLSAPEQDKIPDNKSGVVRKITGASVTYKGPGAVASAWELSPFTEGFSRALTPQGQTVKPADFYLWKVIVLELKGANS
ncbi:MAG TPA: hypothetical protein VGM19_09470 [Armatimonadota bacterium]|jgi:hypothetical protein